VVKPGNSSDWETSVSSATLIRSGGLFIFTAASRIAPAATSRACYGPHRPVSGPAQVMTPRPITAIHSGNARVHTQPAANVIDNQLRDFLVPWKPAHPLEALQRQHQPQQRFV
jgi:hypothetical protein